MAEVEPTQSPSFIRRFDRERAIRVSAEVDKEKYEPGKIQDDIMETELPQVLADFPASAQAQRRQPKQVEIQQDLVRGAVFAVLLIYALMAVPLKSYAQPLLIMSVIPFGIIGAFIGH